MSVPPIYSPRFEHRRLSIGGRILASVLAMSCLTVLCIARLLTPSPEGVSTHTELNMEPCYFLAHTGIPCPSCGMTTSFAWFARGNLAASFYIQPMGCVLAIICAAGFWIGVYIAATGRPAHRLLNRLPVMPAVIGLLVFAAAAWGWKIFIHLHGLDGWK
jgi:hypothetical protein